jgi:hypothetical protein
MPGFDPIELAIDCCCNGLLWASAPTLALNCVHHSARLPGKTFAIDGRDQVGQDTGTFMKQKFYARRVTTETCTTET